MASIKLQVTVLDEHCASCRCLDISKQDLFYETLDGNSGKLAEYSCANLHMCRFIRNRIVRNEQKDKNIEKDVEENG